MTPRLFNHDCCISHFITMKYCAGWVISPVRAGKEGLGAQYARSQQDAVARQPPAQGENT